jgi:hypothetical protein
VPQPYIPARGKVNAFDGKLSNVWFRQALNEEVKEGVEWVTFWERLEELIFRWAGTLGFDKSQAEVKLCLR